MAFKKNLQIIYKNGKINENVPVFDEQTSVIGISDVWLSLWNK